MNTAMATEVSVPQNLSGGALAEFEEVYRSNVGLVAAYFARRCWEPRFGASTTPPAFAVTRNPDGTVTINLRHQSGIAGANKQLAAMGVRAQIAAPDKTPPKLVCPGGTAPTITFDPASIPTSGELVIAPGQPGPGDAAALKPGSDGSGNTAPGAASGDGNHVVRANPGGGKNRTYSAAGNHVVRMYCP
jgi:hypothetical protein